MLVQKRIGVGTHRTYLLRFFGEAMRRRTFGICWPTLIRSIGVAALMFAAPLFAFGQQASISAWDAAHFRIWGYIPY